MKKFFILALGISLSSLAFSETYKCSGDLVFERIINGKSEVKKQTSENLFELSTSQWAKDKITIKDNVGNGFKTTIPINIVDGVVRADHTQTTSGNAVTTAISFDLHSKDSLIAITFTKGNKTLKRTLTGKCLNY
jgi:hypothetical protein